MTNLDLFAWWAISISGGIVFLTLVSIYLYMSSRTGQKESKRKMIDEHSIEFITYIILTVISVVCASVQTLWWLFPGFIFLFLSIFVAIERQHGYTHETQLKTKAGSIIRDFIFVWVLLGLLVFYIVTIQLGSVVLFAIGNVLVEALLIIYLSKNRTEKTEQA